MKSLFRCFLFLSLFLSPVTKLYSETTACCFQSTAASKDFCHKSVKEGPGSMPMIQKGISHSADLQQCQECDLCCQPLAPLRSITKVQQQVGLDNLTFIQPATALYYDELIRPPIS